MHKLLVIAVLLIPTVASSQTQTQTQTPAAIDPVQMAPQSTRDPPPGFPYNTGGNADVPVAQVPLRDFLSSRQDLQHAELSQRIDDLASRMQQVIDERDRQYAQRFAAQEDATDAALASAQEAVRAALESADRATSKAEAAANDRFESVNEFRATLTDQANQFVNKSTADAQFASLNEKVDDLFIRLNTIQAQGQGSADTWGWVVLLLGVLIAFAGVAVAMMGFMNRASRADRARAPAA